MKQIIKPIETIYNNYKFRSRLEAKWAVFFDQMGVEYKYEPEGYDLYYNGYYLPDFYILGAEEGAFLEIKPFINSKNSSKRYGRLCMADREAAAKCVELSMMHKCFVLLVFGDPVDQKAVWYKDGLLEYPCAAIDFPLKESLMNKQTLPPVDPTFPHKEKFMGVEQEYRNIKNASIARKYKFEHKT